MARSLILHIGTHKTGTSSIQRYLSAHAEALLAEGILYPSSGRPKAAPEGHHKLAWSMSRAKQKTRGPVDERCWAEVVEEVHRQSPNLVALSTEEFEILTAEEVGRVANHLATFDVKVVVYLRNQLDFMVSAYKQQLKGGTHGLSFRDFLERNIGRCNYPALLQRWADCFGKGNVIVRVYDREKNDPGIKADFLHLLGVQPETIAQMKGPVVKNVNISPDDETIRLVRLVNVIEQKTTSGRGAIFHTVRRSLVRKRKNVLGKTLMTLTRPFLKANVWTPEDVDWLRQQAAPWNERLFQSFLTPCERPYFDF